MAQTSRFSVDAVFRAIDKFSAPIVKMENKVRKFGRQMERSMRKGDRMANKFFKRLKKLSLGITAVGVATAFIGREVLRTGADFDQGMQNISAITGQTREQMAGMEAQARELGASTVFSAVEVADAMEIMAKAGFDSAQTMQAVPGVLDAAAASGEGIAETANIVSNVLKGMNLEMDQSTRVADVLAAASTKTNSTIGSLGESMKNVAATARTMDIPLETVVAAVASLQDVGLDASVSGSAFNTMLTRMAKPPKKIAQAMRQAGLSFKDAEGNMKPLPDVLDTINQLADKTGGNMNRVAVLADLVGLRGQKAADNLGELFKAGKIQELTEALENAQGAASRMAKTRQDTLLGDIEKLGGELDDLKVAFFVGDANEPLRKIVQTMERWLQTNQKLILENMTKFFSFIEKHGPTILNILVRVGRMVGVFTALAAGMKIATLAMVGFNLVMAANPIGIVIAALGLLAFFWEDIVGIWKEAVIIVEDLFTTIMRWIDPVLTALAPLLDVMGKVASFAFNPVGFIAGALGFGDDEEGATAPGGLSAPPAATPQVQNRTQSTTSTERVQLDINDPDGRTSVTRGRGPRGSGLSMAQSGADR